MALIYRSILDIDDPGGGFVDRASGYFTHWIRLKVYDRKLELPLNGEFEHPGEGVHISVSRVDDDGLSIFRGASFETARADGAEIETQLVAIADGEATIAWIDLDRTATHAAADTDWVPAAPNVAKQILQNERASYGATPLAADEILCDPASAVELAGRVADAERQVPLVAVTSRPGAERGFNTARSRAQALALRLRGVAAIALLDEPSTAAFGKRLAECFNEGASLAVDGGEVHAYLPGIARGGYQPRRHRILGYRELSRNDETYAALQIAPALLQRAVEVAPPAIWRERCQRLVESAGSDERQVRTSRLIALGESAQVEFKSSLRYDAETGGANKELIKSVTKTLAAFLNGEGGTLLIGVADAGEIRGIEPDFGMLRKSNADGFELHLREAIGDHVGHDVSPAIDVTFSDHEGKTVALVDCPAYHQPVFHDDGNAVAFYVRAGNGTRPLDVRETTEYIARRWRSAKTSDEVDIADA